MSDRTLAVELYNATECVIREAFEKAESDINDPTWNLDAHIPLTLTIGELRRIREVRRLLAKSLMRKH